MPVYQLSEQLIFPNPEEAEATYEAFTKENFSL